MKLLPVCEQCGVQLVGHKRRTACYDCVSKHGTTPKLCERCNVNPAAYNRRSTCFTCEPRKRALTPTCNICNRNPVAYQGRPTCFDCVPRRRRAPLRCKHCGSRKDYFRSGLCRRCHNRSGLRDSCRHCLAWGATHHLNWLCQGCHGWTKRFDEGPCPSCLRVVPLNERGYCRMCCRQAHLVRPAHQTVNVSDANECGQQLCFADMLRNNEGIVLQSTQCVASIEPAITLPVPHEQLTLFDITPDLSVWLERATPPSRTPSLHRIFDDAVDEHGCKHGWSKSQRGPARRSLNLLVSAQHAPGRPIKESEIEWLRPLQLYAMTLVREVLISIDMYEDDSAAPLENWFRHRTHDVNPVMVEQVSIWFHATRDGRTCAPRKRKRGLSTVRRNVDDLIDPLLCWTAKGYTSLREVERDDILAVLPVEPHRQNSTAGSLRSLFRFLKANKTIFTNPTARLKAACVPVGYPLPLDNSALRQALDNDRPVSAAIAALAVFHGLSTSDVAELTLTNVHDGRLELGHRSIPLATRASEALAHWLAYRNGRWPNTINLHLFINTQTALRLTPVSTAWISRQVDVSMSAMREDCIVNEAIANGGDARRLGDLFGLTTLGAERYTRMVEQDEHLGSSNWSGV
jgi:integrase